MSSAETAAHPFTNAVRALEFSGAVVDALRTAVDFLEPSHAGFIRVVRYAFVEAVEQLGSELGTLQERQSQCFTKQCLRVG